MKWPWRNSRISTKVGVIFILEQSYFSVNMPILCWPNKSCLHNRSLSFCWITMQSLQVILSKTFIGHLSNIMFISWNMKTMTHNTILKINYMIAQWTLIKKKLFLWWQMIMENLCHILLKSLTISTALLSWTMFLCGIMLHRLRRKEWQLIKTQMILLNVVMTICLNCQGPFHHVALQKPLKTLHCKNCWKPKHWYTYFW